MKYSNILLAALVFVMIDIWLFQGCFQLGVPASVTGLFVALFDILAIRRLTRSFPHWFYN